MKVSEFATALEEFQTKLDEHHKLWGGSLDRSIPDRPIRNGDALREQARWLSRRLGALRPYIERFDNQWMMGHQLSGRTWDALGSAVGLSDPAIIKGDSLRGVTEKLDRIIGRLQTLDQDDTLPSDPTKAMKPGLDADRAMLAYLDCLHPFIANGCAQLYRDGHYAQAVAEASKAVFQYIRNKTGLSGDGGPLAQLAFSVNNPKLAFSDLADQTKKDEQVGFMEMVAGFGKGVRNPFAHTHGRPENAQKAFEYLVVASLFCRRVDDAVPATGASSSP